MIGAPPSNAGAAKETVTAWSAVDASRSSGAPGLPAGVMAAERFDAALVFPAPLVAVTLKVYDRPFSRPGTTTGPRSSRVTTLAATSGVRVSHAVTVYLAMKMPMPPVRVGAANVTVAEPEPGVATTAVGESGTLATTPPASEEPSAFVVVTETVYACPGTRPVSVTGLWAAATIWVPEASVLSVSTTVNPVIGAPLSAGVGQETSAEVPLDVTVIGSAERGGPAGTMVLDWFDARLGPNALMATAVNAYSAPSTRPSMRSPFCARYCGVISTVCPPRVGSVRSSAVTA